MTDRDVMPLPCPFCGRHPGVEPWHGGAPTKRMILCRADECEVQPEVTGETMPEAVARWNHRAPMNATALAGPEHGGDVGELAELSRKATQGFWEHDSFDTEDGSGCYKAASLINEEGKVIADTCNGSLQCIETEHDEDGSYSWDEQGRADLSFVAALVNAYRSGQLVPLAASPSRQEGGEQAVRIAGGVPDLTDAMLAALFKSWWEDPQPILTEAEFRASFRKAWPSMLAAAPQPPAPEGTAGGEPGDGMSDEEAIAHLDAAFARKSTRIGTIPYPPAQAGGDEIAAVERLTKQFEADCLRYAADNPAMKEMRNICRIRFGNAILARLASANSSARDEALGKVDVIVDRKREGNLLAMGNAPSSKQREIFEARAQLAERLQIAIRALRSSTPTKATPGPVEADSEMSVSENCVWTKDKKGVWRREGAVVKQARTYGGWIVWKAIFDDGKWHGSDTAEDAREYADRYLAATPPPHPSKTEPRQDGDREVEA